MAAAPAPAPAPAPVRYERSVGTVSVRIGDRAGRPQLLEGYQHGAGRVRFPRAETGIEAMVLNTSGGLAAGDAFTQSAAAEAHTLTLSTQACERVYRSAEGDPATVTQHYAAGPAATLRILPQPTILFDRAALERRTTVDIAKGATLTLVEGLVFGRAAMGETVAAATVRERLDLHHDGALVYVDALRLTAETFADAQNPAGLAGARATALVLHVGRRTPADAVDIMRAQTGEGVRIGASAVNGVAVARLLASSHSALQGALARIVQTLDGAPVPRAWTL